MFRYTLRDESNHIELFRRLLTPKAPELVATPYRHGSREKAEAFFMDGMRRALTAMHDAAAADVPVTIFYAFKQAEDAQEGLTSAGWASFLQAVIDAGFLIDGTWPLRTERKGRLIDISGNALASSVVLVCRKRSADAPVATRREFLARLKAEMPRALEAIREAGISPVDLPQAALGPGMGIFSSCAQVLEPDDSPMSVRTAIALINELRAEILHEEDAHYDAETRFCIDWFAQFGFDEGPSGDAITMAQAYNLALDGLQRAGVLVAKGGRTRLLRRDELPADWRPSRDETLTVWECAQHLMRVLESPKGGADEAAGLLNEMDGEIREAVHALAYRLYDICERKGWAEEARSCNMLAGELKPLEERIARAAAERAEPDLFAERRP